MVSRGYFNLFNVTVIQFFVNHMKHIFLISFIFINFLSYSHNVNANPIKDLKSKPSREMSLKEIKELEQEQRGIKKPKKSKYYYTYIDRDHTLEEDINNLVAIYGVTWAVYPLTQPGTFLEKGSFKNYKKNFGRLVFDKDEPFWNWFVHPISGSQLYLFYRARGYTKSNAMFMSFISSSLFEFTVEIYTEPASIQDLYQTPILGSALGLGLEKLSLYLLNSGNLIGKTIGHIINPSSLFLFYEGKIRVIPEISYNRAGLRLFYEF